MPPLSESIDALYDAFARNRQRRTVHACPCCHSKAQQDALVSAPLRLLSVDALGCFPSCAMSLFGDVRDFKHFLPRILELSSCTDLFAGASLEKKLRQGEWRSWTPGERRAVESFVVASSLEELRRGATPAWPLIDRMTRLAGDPRETLERLFAETAAAPRWFARMLVALGSGQMTTVTEEVLKDWLLEWKKPEALERAFFAAESAEDQSLFSTALMMIEWF